MEGDGKVRKEVGRIFYFVLTTRQISLMIKR